MYNKVMFGKCVSDGIAIGRITIYNRRISPDQGSRKIVPKKEIARFNEARKEARGLLEDNISIELADNHATNAEILESHLTIIEDPEYINAIKNLIRKGGISAEQAIENIRDSLNAKFRALEDPYMQARAEDIQDVSNRIIRILVGKNRNVPKLGSATILLADDLSPSETMQLDKNKVVAFVTRRGSKLSHTAILSRTMGIPAIVGVDFPDDCDGKIAIVDAYKGEVIISPSDSVLNSYMEELEKDRRRIDELKALVDQPPITADGKYINLWANVGNIYDVNKAIENGAEGIGLFRSEFIYINSDDFPSEEKQYQIYCSAIRLLEGKPLTIRTIDLGGDKQVPYMNMPHEDNPAMGNRAVRYCLGHKDVFKTEIRAILRAAALGNVRVLLPMIISPEEIWQIKEIFHEVHEELVAEGIPCGYVPIGAMIETPAAAIISDIIANEVDFLSIGTNDLTQYTLAVDRQNTDLEFICDYHHNAILRLLKTVIINAHDRGKRVCVCGEIARDTSFTETLLRMGVDELSVSPNQLLKVKQAIRNARVSH